MSGQELYNKINEIRTKLNLGLLSYDEAKQAAKPIIDEMNEKAREVAKKYNQRHRNFTFISLMR